MHFGYKRKERFILFFCTFSIVSMFDSIVGEDSDNFQCSISPDKRQPKSSIPDPFEECSVGFLHQEKNMKCIKKRKLLIMKQRYIFQITNVGQSPDQTPIGFHKLLPRVPWLNRTQAEIMGYYSFNDEESRYLGMFVAYVRVIKKLEAEVRDGMFLKLRGQRDIPSLEAYSLINDAFDKEIRKLQTRYVSNPCHNNECVRETRKDFKPSDDEYFVQRRLAGPCPFNLKKITLNGSVGISFKKLEKKMNLQFDYDAAISEVYGSTMSFEEALAKERLFVLYFEEHEEIRTLNPEFDPVPGRKIRDIRIPIVLLVLNEEGLFKIVSIQTDNDPASEVLKPSSADKEEWLKVKGDAETVDANVCQGFYHSGKIHLSSTIFCIAYRRHIDKYHPLYDFFLHHCEGTIPHISLAYFTLLTPGERADMCMSIGHQGFLQLGAKAFDGRMYGELDFPEFLKTKGLDDTRIKYYPFREDGAVLWEELSGFTNDVVSELYKTDLDVSADLSIETLAMELSPAGLGNVTGFPSSIKTKQALRLFLLRFLWYNVMHTSSNYPLNLHNQVATPTKSYDDANGSPLPVYLQSLPDLYTTVNTTSFATNLANFRVNRILEYHQEVRHVGLQKVVVNSYTRLQKCVQKLLSKRNTMRRKQNLLGFEYFEPKYLTNSIHV